jgi:hypothetical protein
MWELNPSFPGSGGYVYGVAFDSATSRIFMSAQNSQEGRPLVHVFTVTAGTTSPPTTPTPAPTAPTNVRVIR